MTRFQFSLGALLAAVAGIAIVMGAIRLASGHVATIALGSAVLVLAWAVVAAVWSQTRPAKVFWCYLAIFGWVWLSLTCIPGLKTGISENSAINNLLGRLYRSLARPRPMTTPPTLPDLPTAAVAWVRGDNSVWVDGQVVDLSESDALEKLFQGKQGVWVYFDPDAEVAAKVIQAANNSGAQAVSSQPALVYMPPDDFLRTVHSMLALLIGLIAGTIARFWRGGARPSQSGFATPQ